jgi:hypothetical protein
VPRISALRLGFPTDAGDAPLATFAVAAGLRPVTVIRSDKVLEDAISCKASQSIMPSVPQPWSNGLTDFLQPPAGRSCSTARCYHPAIVGIATGKMSSRLRLRRRSPGLLQE